MIFSLRGIHVARYSRRVWHFCYTRLLVARFPRLKPWADSYVNGCAVNIIIQFFNVLYAPKWEFGLELVQDSLPVAKTGSFFVSFCVFEGA